MRFYNHVLLLLSGLSGVIVAPIKVNVSRYWSEIRREGSRICCCLPNVRVPKQNEELYEVVTTVGGSSKANVKFKITFTSADQAVQKKIFQAPPDISWPYLQEKLQSMFSLQRSNTCVFFSISQAGGLYGVK